MALQIIQRLVSDLSGETAEKTVRFGLNGKEWMIDLTGEEEDELISFLSKFIAAGIRTNSVKAATRLGIEATYSTPAAALHTGPAPDPVTGHPAERKAYLAQVRGWAQGKKLPVAERGRIPQSILDMYENRHVLESAAIAEAAEKVKNHKPPTHLDAVDDHGTPVKAGGDVIRVPVGKTVAVKATSSKVAVPAFSDKTSEPPAAVNGHRRGPAKRTTTRAK